MNLDSCINNHDYFFSGEFDNAKSTNINFYKTFIKYLPLLLHSEIKAILILYYFLNKLFSRLISTSFSSWINTRIWALTHNSNEFWAKAKNLNHQTHDLKVVAIEKIRSFSNCLYIVVTYKYDLITFN
jgi:hypothetical protein